MSKSAILRARVDAKMKTAAESVFHKLGISLGDAINLFLGQVSIQKGIPFPLTTRPHLDLSHATIEEIEKRYADRILNTTTQAALKESTRGARRYKSASDVLKALRT